MSRRTRNYFDESLALNQTTYHQYLERLTGLSTAMFEWVNLPDTVDSRYLEMTLFRDGRAVFFEDEVIGHLALSCSTRGNFNVYGYPLGVRAYSRYNNYQKNLDTGNSVIIWNNYTRTNSVTDVKMFARRLANIDRIIDVNANAQKTPVLVQATETQRLTMLNLYKEFDGNAPVIFGDKNLDLNALKVLKTDAPYVADKLTELKNNIWNEALTYLGISNISFQKKERMVTDEAVRSQGGTIASRYSRLNARREAVDQINRMFGLEIEVNYREDYREIDDEDVIVGQTGNENELTDTMVQDLNTNSKFRRAGD